MKIKLWLWAVALAVAPLCVSAQGLPSPVSVQKIVTSPGNMEAVVGEIVNYQITIANTLADRKIVQLTLQDIYPSMQMEFVSAEPAPTFVDDLQSFITWSDLTETFGDLSPGQSVSVSVSFRAVAPSSVAPAINSATVSGVDDEQMQFTHPPVQASVAVSLHCAPDAYEPNDTVNGAKLLPLDQAIRAYICPEGDVDIFNLSLPDAGTYYVKLFNLPADYQLYVRDAAGGLAGSSENAGTAPEEVQIVTQSANRFTVEVLGNQAFSYSRSYELKVSKPELSEAFLGDGSVMPSGQLILSGMNLPTGLPAVQRTMRFYLNTPGMDTHLGDAPLLPGGRVQAAIKIPDGIMGPQNIVGQLVEDNMVIQEVMTPVVVQLLQGYFELWVDDAWKPAPNYTMPIVNKIIPLSNNFYGATQVDVVGRFKTAGYAGESVKIRILVQGNKFGSPDRVFVRNGFNGTEANVAFVALGGGQYEATIPTPALLEDKQLVFRFGVPSSLSSPQTVNITGAALSPSNEILREIKQARKVRLQKGYSGAIFLNRNTLFRDFAEVEVADLLAELYIHSAEEGNFGYGVHDKRATIYYVDRYRSESSVRNWNNMTVDYSSEFNANRTARAIWFFMQEILLNFTTPKPFYVMIVGNDEQFPFYRMNDPFGDEDTWLTTGGGNPAMQVTRENMYFTDNFYAWFLGGSVDGSWRDGNIDLVIGRIIGDGAEDMKNFFLRGVTRSGGTNRAVMASVDGWELGYEPDDNRAGEIKDYLNVPGRLAARGFGVYNDAESPRTIDKMDPYPSNWNTGFKNAANAGADLFFIGGHNDYRFAGIPGDNFDPGDIPSKYTRFDDDNPIVMIVGCHGGLPVPAIGTWPGGANNSMVYGVIRRGARAYYGAAGFSYGSPGNLHVCTWGELLLQHNFHVFTQSSLLSSTLGYAVRQGKINFPFGVGNNYGLDQKTVTEFNLFGVPWQRWAYPGSGGSGAAALDRALSERTKPGVMPPGAAHERGLLLAPRRGVKAVAGGVYQQTFPVAVDSWSTGSLEIFDVIEIPGGELQFIPGAPVLPALRPFSIALPTSGTILTVAVENLTTSTLGEFNIPTTEIAAWTVSGITLTGDSALDSMWPPQIAEMSEAGERHHVLTVFPVRHNPATNATVLHETFDVVVTYEAPVAIGILNFGAVEKVIGAGQTPAFTADVFNMGDTPLTLMGSLVIRDEATSDVVDGKPVLVNLAPGAVFPLVTSSSAALPAGRYSAELKLAGGVGIEVSALDGFEAGEALLSNLTAVYDVNTGQAAFSVNASSLLDKTAALEVAFAISEEVGGPLDAVIPDAQPLGSGETVQVSAVWTPGGSSNMVCQVEAIGALDGGPMNSVKAVFAIMTPQGLLDALINHILERELMGSAERQTADLNQDGNLDSADVILAVELVNAPGAGAARP